MNRRILGTLIVVLMLFLSVSASAENTHDKYIKLHKQSTTKFGKDTVGRNIVLYGMPGRDAKREEIVTSIKRMNSWLHPPKLVRVDKVKSIQRNSSPSPTRQQSPVQDSSGSGGGSGSGGSGGSGPGEGTANCESGGNPKAISPGGKYRGKYQFDQQTWNAHGGTGDPAAAPESVQDEIAGRVQYDAWPNC